MTQDRQPLPESTKRSVRQRCGFGCVICGLPLYEYDHVTPLAEGGIDEAGNITLLCSMHHAMKTRGLLSARVVTDANAAPKNRQAGRSAPFGVLDGVDRIEVRCGSNRFYSKGPQFVPFVVDGRALIAVELQGECALLYLWAFDRSNRLALEVVQNEVVHMVDAWDITFRGPVLQIRSAPRDILIRVRFDPAGIVTVEKATLYYNGVGIGVTSEGVTIGGLRLRGSEFEGTLGVVVGDMPPDIGGAAIHLPVVDRYDYESP